MAYSYFDYEGTDTTIQTDILCVSTEHMYAFKVLSEEESNVTLSDVALAATFTKNNAGVLCELGTAPSTKIRIIRSTPYDVLMHDFSNGAQFNAFSVDEVYEQVLYLCQEIVEGKLIIDSSGNFSGTRACVSPNDAENNGQLLEALGMMLDGVATVESVADLRSRASKVKTAINLIGYHADLPGIGGGLFVMDAADKTTADNGGTVIVAADGTRWKRQADDAQAEYFGARGNGVADDTAALAAARDWAKARKCVLRGSSKYKLMQALDVRELAVDMLAAEFVLSGDGQLVIGGHAGSSWNPNQSFGKVLRGAVKFDETVYTVPSVKCIGSKGQKITLKYTDYLQFFMSTDPATYPRDSSQAYSTFDIGFAIKISIDTDPRFAAGVSADGAGSANQWFNENVLNLNRCFAFYMRGSYRHNCNYIVGGSFESQKSFIDIQIGNKNRFVNTRLENVRFVRFSEATEGNILERSYFPSVALLPLNVDDKGVMNRVETAVITLSEKQRVLDLNPFTPRWNGRPQPYHAQQISRIIRAGAHYGQIAETEIFMMRGREDILIFDFDNTASRYQVRLFVFDANGNTIEPQSLTISSGFLAAESDRFAGSPSGGQEYGRHRFMVMREGVYYVRVEVAATDNRLAGNSKYFTIDLYSARPRSLPQRKQIPTTAKPSQYIGFQGDVIQYKTGRAHIDVHIQTSVSSFGDDYIVVKNGALGTTVLQSGDIVGIEGVAGDVQWGAVVTADNDRINLGVAVPAWLAVGDAVYISRIAAV